MFNESALYSLKVLYLNYFLLLLFSMCRIQHFFSAKRPFESLQSMIFNHKFYFHYLAYNRRICCGIEVERRLATYNMATPCNQSLPGQLITWPPHVYNCSRSRCPSYVTIMARSRGTTWLRNDFNPDPAMISILTFSSVNMITLSGFT